MKPWHPDRRALIRAGGTLIAAAALAEQVAAQSTRIPVRGGVVDSVDADDHHGRFRRPRVDKPLFDTRIARGDRNIAAAWFSDPTPRYRHFVLGSQHEAETLVVSLSDRRVLKLKLDAESVFEDRQPRLADVDGDGEDEVVVVRSYLKAGAALAIAKVKGDALEIVAETPPIGQPNSWLNPIGIADFDGDRRPEIALVKMPHVLGELQLWTLRRGELVLKAAVEDASNHASGSRHQGLSAIADFDGDRIADIAVPTLDRRTLRFLSFRGGRGREIARVSLPTPATESFKVVEKDGAPAVQVGFNAGRTMIVAP